MIKKIALTDERKENDIDKENERFSLKSLKTIDIGMPNPMNSTIPIMGRVRVKKLEHDRVHYH